MKVVAELSEIRRSYTQNGELVWEFIKRDFLARYRGSFLGVGWSLVTPLVMLAVYYVVFGLAFQRSSEAGTHRASFVLTLFAGLMVHNFVSEALNRAPSLIVSHPNYVKKVVFPLEVLPLVSVCSAGIQFTISAALLLVCCLIFGNPIHPTVFLTPVVMLPISLITLGLSLFLSSLGVYLRDISQGIGMITSAMLFLSPVFYPMSALPETYRPLLLLNPVTIPVEQFKEVLLYGEMINWLWWSASLLVGCLLVLAGHAWFQKSRMGFADAL